MILNIWSKIKKRIIFYNYLSKSRKISLILRKLISKNERLSILDIGAGNRYLPILLNFDGSAYISMVDPHKNLFWSFENLKKNLIYKNLLRAYKVGIGKNTKKKTLYIGKRSTGSTFLNIFNISKKKKIKLNMNYFSKSKEVVQIYKFCDFLIKYKLKRPDIVKIDVEGLEFEVLDSILNNGKPYLIQIESNVNSDLYGNTFDQIHKKLTSLNYSLVTLHPNYYYPQYSSTKKSFLNDNYEYPKIRSKIEQVDSIYILKKKITLREILILIGYGFLSQAFQFFTKFQKKLKKKNRILLKIFFKKHIPYSIFKTL
jgi:FkbM family methyltransferase